VIMFQRRVGLENPWRVLMKRYGTPGEIAGGVSILASDDALYVTGQTLAVDGGFVAAGLLEI